MSTIDMRARLVLVSLMIGLLLGGHPVSAQQEMSYDELSVLAVQAFTQKSYAVAVERYRELVKRYPGAEGRDGSLLNLAKCCLALDKEEEALLALEQLRSEYPTSDVLPETLALLYPRYLAHDATPQAEAVWMRMITGWPESPSMRQVIRAFYDDAARRHPERCITKVEEIAVLRWSPGALGEAVFTPLLNAGRFDEARAIEQRLSAVARGARREYLNSFTMQHGEQLFARLTAARTAGDPVAARKWLSHLNAVMPEYPRAVEARALVAEQVTKPGETPMAIVPQDGFNLRVVEQYQPAYLIVKVDTPVQNWFAGQVSNLPTDRPTTIGLFMLGNDSDGNSANVSKWTELRPVMTYADPTKYESYEWFQKDAQGRWVSGDPFKQGEAKYAGTGKVPEQHAMPAEVAEDFLSSDGRYWQPWREIATTDVLRDLNIFRMTEQFKLPTATVAMRVPYTYTYLQQYIARLQAAKLPGVTVDDLGATPGGRRVQVIRVEPAQPVETTRVKTVLVTAREHATEAATSWALQGMLDARLSAIAEGRAPVTEPCWLFLPIQDPDGSAASLFDHLTSKLAHASDPATPPEVFLYARYFIDYVNAGKTIDVSMALHNVAASECENVMCPFVDARHPDQAVEYNKGLFAALNADGFRTASPEKYYAKGWMNFRLYGWCALHFGTFDLAFEVNDRYPANRLSIARLQQSGAVIARYTAGWLADTPGQTWHQQVRAVLAEREKERSEFFRSRGYGPAKRTKKDIIIRAF